MKTKWKRVEKQVKLSLCIFLTEFYLKKKILFFEKRIYFLNFYTNSYLLKKCVKNDIKK